MSQRTIIEINHDCAKVDPGDMVAFMRLWNWAISSGDPQIWDELSRWGIHRVVQTHHSTPRKVIVYEGTGWPYDAPQFRVMWRKCAKEAGVPAAVFNMDSRAGAISEASDAGAPLEHIRHAATHSDTAMTQKYSRGSEEKIAEVQRKRAEHRNKK